MRFYRIPPLVKFFGKRFAFFGETTIQKVVYLTFDDGPHPQITDEVLKILGNFNARATFFCIGSNVEKHAATYKKILDSGHTTGNHTMHHLKGWKSSSKNYLNDIKLCASVVKSGYFRPPHGEIQPLSIRAIRKNYKIIMWSLLSRDFDLGLSPGECTRQTLKRVKPGDVIVFHDSEKAYPRLIKCLPALLRKLSDEGYKFLSLSEAGI